MKITKRLEMDLSAQGHIPCIDTVQEDACRWVELSLYDGTAPWAIPEGVTAAVAYRKPDGTKGLYDTLPDGSSACLIDGNVVVFALPPQALSIPGHVATTVVFWDADLRPLSTFKMTLRVEESPAVGAVKSEDYFSLSVAIDAAIKAAESPLLVVTVNGDSENGFTVNTAGAELVKAINANKSVLCYWKNKNVYLQMSRYYSDQDITFSSVYKSVEYIINVNSIANTVRYSHINTLGTGSKGVYVGTQEPQNDSVDLWINPDLAEDENQFVPVPKKATVGQVMVVKSVNGEGKPTEWKPVDMSIGGATQDDIQRAVDAYMAENPVEVQEGIPVPTTASVGQTIVVKSVDETGKPTEWEAADLPSGGRWKLLADLTTTEDVTNLQITADMDGNSVPEQNFSEIYMHYFLVAKEGYASRYSALSVWFNGGFGGGENSTYENGANGYDNVIGSVYGICPQQHRDTTYGRRLGISFCTISNEVKKFTLGATDKMAICLRSEAGIVAGSRFIVYGR